MFTQSSHQAGFLAGNRRSPVRVWAVQILVTLLLPGLLSPAAEPGSVDLTFDPPEGHGGAQPFLVVVDSYLYLAQGNA
ncbi:MAG: hypothetical protein J0L84_09355, partial [Verrucomicrobia bacterium]|nr:hypothetical protein [Verrucomicrobiota bacterium]